MFPSPQEELNVYLKDTIRRDLIVLRVFLIGFGENLKGIQGMNNKAIFISPNYNVKNPRINYPNI